MTTSSTIPCKRIISFLSALVIASCLFTTSVHAQVAPILQQRLGVSNVIQGTNQNQITPTEMLSGCNCNTFSICITSQVNDNCDGGNNGSATVTASGGDAPYTYSWNTNPKQTKQTATGLSAGTYTVTVTDNMGCTATACVTITQGSQISISVPTPSPICNGSKATLTVSGSTCSSYTWSPSTGLSATTGSSVTADPTITTTYTVTGTNSSGCTGTAKVVVAVNPTTTINVTCPSSICQGSCASLKVSGSPCESYTWTPSSGLTVTTGSSISACPTVTTTYTVTGSDNNGCPAKGYVVVIVNPTTTINVTCPSSICQGSCASLKVSGSPCESYTWTPSSGLTVTTGSSISACPTVTTTYTVTGSDNNGCPAKGYVVVTVNPTTTINVNTPSAICQGSCASLKVSGSPCESYTWTPSSGLAVTTGSSISACPTVTTTYTVTGSDNNGCPAKGYVVVTVNPTTTINVNTPSAICKGTCATLTINGAPCESYTWSPSTGLSVTTGSSISACPTITTTYTVTGSDHNNCPATGTVVVTVNPTTTITVNTPSAICKGNCAPLTVSGAPCTSYTWTPSTGLSVTTGSSISACPTITTTYTVTGSDHNNCPATGTVVVTVNPTTTITVNTPSPICDGTCATLTVSGAPCTSYTWTPSTGLTVTTGSSISACPTATTTYTVTGSDHNNCPATGTVVVTVNQTTTITVNTPSAICKGTCATLTVSGTPCTSYTWTPSTGLTVTTGSSILACPTLTTTYTVTGSDHNGCPATGTVVVTVNPTTTITVNTPSPICDGTCATLTVSGAPCTSYTWTPSTGLTVTTGSSISACPTATTTYTVTGSDHNNCPATGNVVVTVNPLPTITLTVNDPTICKGGSDTLKASGLEQGGTYTWSPATGLSATTGSSVIANPTVTTTYTLYGKNPNGCIDPKTVVVYVNQLQISVTPGYACINDCANLTATGATYYTWSPATALSATTGSSVTACPGATTTYTIIGTNGSGCIDTTTTVVTIYPLPVIKLTAKTHSVCSGSPDTITASGASIYTWSPSTGLNVTTGSVVIASPTVTTTYTVIGINGNGCVCNDTIVIKVGNKPVITLQPRSNTMCAVNGQCDGHSFKILAMGTDVIYQWYLNGQLISSGLNDTVYGFSPGIYADTGKYVVIVSNQCGADTSDTASFILVNSPVINVPSTSVCQGSCTTLTATGTDAIYYSWSPSTGLSATTGSSVTVCPTVATTYTIIATGIHGCTDTTTAVVTINPKPTIHVPSDTICYGNCATLQASGLNESGSYTWSPSTGLGSTTGTTVSACPTITTTYTIIGVNGYGCSDTTTAVVLVNPKPVITATSDTVCYGKVGVLTASGASTYTWSPAGGLSSTTGSSVTVNVTLTTTYTVIGTNTYGCTDTTTAVLKVNPKPVITATSDTVCYGKPGVLTASGASTYTWSPAGGLSSTTGSSVTVNVTLTTTYTVIGTNTYGCTDTTTAVLKVNPKPTINVPSDTICYGNCATLQASGLNESGSYTWSPSTGLGSTTGTTVSACPTVTTTYTIIGINGFGCSDTTTAVVLVNPKPTIHVPSDTICYGNCATLQATGLNESGSYTWSPSAGLGSTTGTTVSACPTVTTTYTIIGINGFGCSDTTTAVVLVNPKPVITATSDTICYGKTGVLTASGASTYTWSPAGGLSSTIGSSVTVNVTLTTTYTVIGTNTYGCTDTTTAVLKVNPKPTINVPSDTICYGNCATLQASGLNESGSYTWSPSTGLGSTTGTTVSACPTITTTYTIIGINGFGCSDTTTAVVLVNPKPTIHVPSDTICYGNCATLQASGLNESGSYTWSPSTGLGSTTGTTVSACPTVTTTYTIIGINGFGCSDTTTVVVLVNPKPTIHVPSDTICYGNCATLQATGLNESGSYTWSPSTGLGSTTGTTVSACPTVTTTYTIIGINGFGCSDTTTAVVLVNPKPTINVPSDTICYGNCATLQATGLNESGSYTWSPSTGLGSTTGTTVSACPTVTTTYTIIGINGFGCSDTTTVVVLVNPKPTIHVPSDTICYGNCATLQATGLNESGSYTWSPSTGLGSTTGTTVSACPTVTTTYTIIGINGFGCSDTTTAVVLVNPKPTINVPSDTICYGNCATLQATGLNESGSYTWSPSTGLGSTTGTTVSACPTVTTTYTIIGINGFGCSDTTTAVVLVNPKPVITATSDTVCYGKPGVLTASGASTYTWSPAGGLSSTTGSSVTVNVTLTTTYTVIGTNTYGCTDTTTAVILVNPKPVITATSDTVCYGKPGVLTASGASTYTWSPAGGLSSTTGSSVTVNVTLTTTYTVIGTNTYGCTDTTTAVLKVNPKPTINVPSDTICYGNCATLQASGLNESGSYTWSPSTGLGSTTGTTVSACPTVTTTYTIIGINGFGCSDTTTAVVLVNPKPTINVPSDTICYGNCATLQATGLNESGSYTWSPSAGLGSTTGTTVSACPTITTTYTVIGVNGYGCSDTTTAVVLVNPKPVITATSDTVCYGKVGVLTASGASTYTWSPAGGLSSTTGYSVTVNVTLTTTYTVIGTNTYGCTDTTTAVLKVNPKPTINVPSDTICYGNCATLQATGLNESGSYTWSPSAGLGSTTGTTVSACPTITTTYTVIGVNGYGCSDTTTAVVLVNPKPVITATSDTVCYGKVGVLTASGASTYTWSPAGGLSSTTGSSVTVNVTLTTTYTVIGTNTYGCTDTTTAVLKVNPKPTINVPSDTICYGNCATLQASGLNESGSYTWSPSTGLGSTTGTTVSACPTVTTTYTIIGINGFGCSDTTTAVVLVNPKPVITATSDTVCYGKTGVLTASGASTYTWSPAGGLSSTTGSSVTVNVTLTTTYTVIGTNTSGCSDTTTAVILVNPKPVVTATSDTVCLGNAGVLTASGASTYTWSPAKGLSATTGSSVTVNVRVTTTYTVVGTNAYGCTDTTTSVLEVNPKPTINVPSDTICYGNCTTLQASGLNESGSYIWSPSSGLGSTTGTTVSACPTVTTTYTIIGINGYGCSDTTTAVVLVNPKPIINVPSDTICFGNCATLQASGLNESGSYTWSPSTGLGSTTGTTVSACPTVTTTYTIIGINGYGCSDTTTAVVLVNPKPIINVPSDTICYGNCATLQASGLNESGTYIWSPSIGLRSTTGTTVSACPTTTTTYTIIGINGYGCSDTTTTVVTVTPSTTIITELNNDTVCAGASVTFTVSATGSNLTYTWQKNWVALSGHSSDTLNIPSATLADSGLYSVIVSGTCGTDTSSATLKVNSAPGNIILNVNGKTGINTPDSIALCAGEPLDIYITNNNLNITDTIVWQKNDTTIAGQTTYIYTIPAVAGNNAGTYRAIVTSPCGADTSTFIYVFINSNTVVDTLTVNDSTITSKLRGIAVCDGSSATFSVQATGSDLTYQWQHNGSNLSGDTSATYTIPSTVLSDSGRYDVIVTGACGTDTSYAYLRINTKPVITSQPSSQSMCGVNGQCGGFSLCVQAIGVNLHYQWYFDGTRIQGATDSCYSVSPATFADTGRYRVLVYNECGSDTSNVAIFRLYDAPSITSQPTSVHVCAVNGNGGNVSFCVQATGVNLHYQWYFGGRRIEGATDSCYLLTPATLSDTGRYRVIVANECGSDTSSVAILRINTPPVITCQPKSESLCSTNGRCNGNGGVTFCVTATGNNLTYQWQYDGRDINGANSSCYTINPVTVSDSGRYSAIVSNSCGSDTSSVAVLTIGSSPDITSQPVCVAVCSGSSATFCVTATGTNLTYQWEFNGKKINGANSSCYTIQSATSWNAGCYTVVVSNSCGSVTSATATLTINTPPVITCQPKGESLCATNGKCGGNDGVTFCVTATGNNISYQWQYNGNNIRGAHSSCYTINPVTTSDAGNYRVIVSNSCGSDTSNCAVLTIGSSPYITSQPVCESVCSGSSATFCVTATGSNLTYQWQFNGKDIRGANACCYTISSSAACNAGCYDVVVSNSCGSVTSSTATLTINTSPNITCQPQGQSLCSTNGKCGGSNGVTFCVTATGSSLSYQWQYNGKNINGAHSSCYTINPVTSSNAGCYDVIVSNSCGSVTSNTATLTIGSTPDITSQPACTSVCSGSSATFCVTATGSNITYQWQFNGKDIRGATTCCYTISSAAACNAGCYDVVVSNSCGSTTSSTATLTISTSPTITCQPQGQSLCSSNGKCGGNDGVTFCVTATGSNLNYQWQYNGKNINGAHSSCYTINPVTSSNAGCYDVIVSNSCGSVTSNTATLTIGSTPDITSQPACTSVCAGSGATFCVTATGSNITYQWQFNGKNICGATSSCYTIESVAACNAGCYDVIVSNTCGSVTSNNATLTVNNCSTCNVPSDLTSSDITCTSAVLSWSYSSSALSFTVEYRAKGCSTWSTKTVTTNSVTLTCFESGTTYQWSVNENCSCGSSSGYASVVDFCTSNNCCNGNNMSPRGDGDHDSSNNTTLINDVKVYPNPTFSLTTVHATFEKESDVTVMVTDITGRIIMSENESTPAGDYIHQFDMSKQPQGTYFLIIRSGDQMVTSKIVKIE